jgi:hypothetical protein
VPDRTELEQRGFDLGFATEEQIAVIESLSNEEVVLLLDIRRRLDDAAGDVEGHIEGGGFCW